MADSSLDRSKYGLRNSSWVLPGLPWGFGALYLCLSVVEEPFRPDLLIAGFIALTFAFLCLASNLTSRVLITSETLDVRDYGVRHVLDNTDITVVYTIPSTFSTIIAFRGKGQNRVTIHLGYWRNEPAMLAELGHLAMKHGIACSPKAAKLLKVDAADVGDEVCPNLVEGVLALTWILSSTVLPVALGLLVT